MTPTRRSWIGGGVVAVLKLLLVLVLIGMAGVAFIVFQLRNNYPDLHAVPAGATWSTTSIALTTDRSVASGTVTLEVAGLPQGGVRVGVNAGAPIAESPAVETDAPAQHRSARPAVVIDGPRVRLTARPPDAPTSCVAPCELQVPPSFACANGSCRMVFEIAVELLGAPRGGGVTVSVAGGVSPITSTSPPGATTISVTFEPPTRPGPT